MDNPIDLYCERTGPELWSEPVNALTNLAFLVAAAFLLRAWLAAYRHRPAAGWDRLLLAILVAAIGIGSGLFHTFARAWAEAADVLPIALFISVFLLVSLKRLAGLGWPATLAWFAAYHGVNALVKRHLDPDLLNGSVFYLPSFAALALLAAWLAWRGHARRRLYLAAVAVFLVSLGFRSVDMALCDAWPLGTHFLWHVLNGILLWMLVSGVMDGPGQAQASRKG